MSKLNERNDNTKGVIHLLITSLCSRNCKYCCNKQYDLNDIPYVTNEELREAHTLCLTGGEPFQFSDPCEIAKWYKIKYPNIKNVYVYTNAFELATYLSDNKKLHSVDGLTVSIKDKQDRICFDMILTKREEVTNLNSNVLYVFNNLFPKSNSNFAIFPRVWQEDFVAANDSIFRKV